MMVHGGLCLAYAALHYRRDTLTGSRADVGRGAGDLYHPVREEEEFYRRVDRYRGQLERRSKRSKKESRSILAFLVELFRLFQLCGYVLFEII
jgi:hypothetical protein